MERGSQKGTLEATVSAPHALRDYALLADGERGVLVGPRGEFAWMCFPRWHDDAVFSALVGGESAYAICPRGRFVWGSYYEPGTLIWRSRWITEEGIVECREALAVPAAADCAVVLRRAIPPDDPRTLATLAAVEAELTQDGYGYRYQPDGKPLGEAEGAFLLCGFWLALAHAQQDDPVKAIAWFERNRAACGPPGLLSEEFDVRQRQLRGNLPQAFVHALLLECSAMLGSG